MLVFPKDTSVNIVHVSRAGDRLAHHGLHHWQIGSRHLTLEAIDDDVVVVDEADPLALPG